MPSTRKRPAPGTSPLPSREQFAKDNRTTSPDVLQNNPMGWQYQNQGAANDSPSQQNANNFATYQNSGQTDQYLASTAQQLARRPVNGYQNLVQAQHDGTVGNGQWAGNEDQTPTGDWPVQYDDLDQRAEIAKRDAQSKRKQIPPFIQKLSSFLDESRNTDLIRWSDSGDSFIVLDEDEFAKTLIPELFKHNNYASFVRQLNMYGFHKKVGLSDNSMRASERKNKNPSEYSNPYFKRGRPNLLWLIHKPKNPPGKGPTKGKNKQDDFDEEVDETFGRDNSPLPINQDQLESNTGFRQQPLLTMGNMADRLPQNELPTLRQEIRELQANQLAIRDMLRQTRQEHQQLYGQAKAFHELHEKHDNSINAILSFLATVYNKNLAAGQAGSGEMFPNAIPSKDQPHGNVVDIGDDNQQTQQPFRKPQLLLEARHPSPTSPANTRGIRRSSRQDNNSLFYDHQTHSPTIQELSDTNTASNRSSQSPQFRPTDASSMDNRRQIPEADILRMMNNASGGGGGGGGPSGKNTTMRMDFPEALSHLQTADGQSPLTPNQRQNVLRLMGDDLSAASPNNNNSGSSSNQALALPSTPPNLSNMIANNNDITNANGLATYDYSADAHHLNTIEKAMRQHDERLNNLQQNLAPLSPSGSIPGISHPSPSQDFSWAMNDDLFGSGASNPDPDLGYFNADGAVNFEGSPYNGNNNMGLNIDDGGDLGPGVDMNVPDFDFDLPGEGGGIDVGGTGRTTAATTDTTTADAAATGQELDQSDPKQGGRSPGKRRRRN